MLLAKIKPTVLTLLMTLCLSAGAVTLTYGAGTEPATKTDNPSATARADKYDLEALRLEIEALRASLQATRERVKSLEADVVAQKALETSRKTSRLDSATGVRFSSREAARCVYRQGDRCSSDFPPQSPTLYRMLI